ncbi:MAG: hypothetical protein EHM21_14295 [Chloroflexi bacterium]|nr:MAG: hypothetical protein EHM21_14295 [Chloroflexota bacterium]
MTLSEAFALTSFALFSISDLRTRLVPGIEWFFTGAILLTLPASPIQTGLVVLAASWGLLRNRSGLLALPLFFYSAAWPVLLTGYGHRRGLVGRADLLAIAGLACLLPFPAVLLSLFGLEAWRRSWLRRKSGPIPALPGLLLGLLAYLSLRLMLS